MKLRTKICLITAIAMLVMSQSFSAVMLYVSQKQRIKSMNSYEQNLFDEKLNNLDKYIRDINFDSLSVDMQDRVIQDGSRKYLGMEYAVYRNNQEVYNLSPYEFGVKQEVYNKSSHGSEDIGAGGKTYGFHEVLELNQTEGYIERKVAGRNLLIQGSKVRQSEAEKSTYLAWHYVDLTDIYKEAGRTFLVGLGASLLLTAFLTTALIWLIHALLKPLYLLQNTANQVADGQYGERVPIARRDEIGEISHSFNLMANRVEEHIQELSDSNMRQKQLMGSLAHELKTPMTALIGYSDALLKMKLSPEQKEKSLKYIGGECRRLSGLSAKMLELTGLYQEASNLEFKEVSVRQFVEKICDLMENRFQTKKLVVRTNLPDEGVSWRMDEDLMTSLLMNLADNAYKASDTGGNIGVEADEESLIVWDEGIGIPEEEVNRVTEAFYMVDKSRSKAAGGAGLGLALCREIAQIHGGNLLIESEYGKGTKVTLHFHKLVTT